MKVRSIMYCPVCHSPTVMVDEYVKYHRLASTNNITNAGSWSFGMVFECDDCGHIWFKNQDAKEDLRQILEGQLTEIMKVPVGRGDRSPSTFNAWYHATEADYGIASEVAYIFGQQIWDAASRSTKERLQRETK